MTEEIKFEKALEKLEKIVEDLESGDISLDEALKKYEEGVELSRACQKKLQQAEKKIEILTRGLDGTLKRESFDASGDAAPEGRRTPKSGRKKMTASEDGEDEDLLI
jgi:exodeoxyribonuclease VII small subunit